MKKWKKRCRWRNRRTWIRRRKTRWREVGMDVVENEVVEREKDWRKSGVKEEIE